VAHWQANGASVLLTGGSSGIGRALTYRLVERGAQVLVVARRAERLQQMASELSTARGRFDFLAGDLTSSAFREEVLRRATARFAGRLDLLVNNAGVGRWGPFVDSSPEHLRLLFELNFFAVVELTRGCLPVLRAGRQPTICNIGSVLGHVGVPLKSEYCASKFAVRGWTDGVRPEFRRQGIRVVLISPSTTRSEFFDSALSADQPRPPSIGSVDPETVASISLRAIERGTAEVIISPAGKALVTAGRWVPSALRWIFDRQRLS
jgi:short-subunit dehydrogenase